MSQIFDREREFTRCYFEEGGKSAETEARSRYKDSLKAIKPTDDWESRKELISQRRERAMERIRRQDEERKQKMMSFGGRGGSGMEQYQNQQAEREEQFRNEVQSKWDMFKGFDADGSGEGGKNDEQAGGERGEEFGGAGLSDRMNRSLVEAARRNNSLPAHHQAGAQQFGEPDPEENYRLSTYSCLDAPSCNPAESDFDARVNEWVASNASGMDVATTSNVVMPGLYRPKLAAGLASDSGVCVNAGGSSTSGGAGGTDSAMVSDHLHSVGSSNELDELD